ncbi:MAG: TonB-dependent receptor plug domain-containing protein, partial [Ignavibacteriae bacterium]|nr:TonB-dependent receptor plug domain-containing protein [Ignavibacteriota bacterium]
MEHNLLSSQTILSFVFILFTSNIFAQVDSIKSYKLDEVEVQSSILVEPKPIMKIDSKIIQNSDAVSLNEISKQIPSVKIQNNSRGESQIYFRGSSTRQLTLFFDGIPLNIPWDNRIDLSLLPTNAIDNIEITKGIPSTIYGPNTISGIVNISSLKYDPKRSKQIKIIIGENYFQNYSSYWSEKINKLEYLISLSYFSTNGFNLPNSFANPENSEELRINSASETLSGFAKVGYEFSNNSKMSLSLSSKSSKKNVPPEIDVSSPRYWKYPEWKHNTLILNGTHGIFNGSNLSYSFSITKFKMQIDQYKSIDYKEIEDTEYNDDLTFYGRLLYSSVLSQNSLLKFIASGLSSLHNEKFLVTGLTE